MAEQATKPAASAAGGGADPVSAIANAAGKLFQLIGTALQPQILATQAYFQQLLNAKPSLQNPLDQANQNRRANTLILLYAGVAVILLLIVVIAMKNRPKT